MEGNEDIAEIRTLFFAAVPLRKYPPPLLESCRRRLSTDNSFLARLLNATYADPICLQYPVPLKHQRAWLKWIVGMVETLGVEEADVVYESHAALLSRKDFDPCFKTYFYGSSAITLIESPFFISAGTTGLTSWTASFLACDWIGRHARDFSGKRVLELGSGVGLVGILLARIANPVDVMLTDGHDDVVDVLRRNVALNVADDDRVRVMRLNWSTFHRDFVNSKMIDDWDLPDVILACDVVFDIDVVPSLVGTLKYFLASVNKKSKPASRANWQLPEALVASNVRNIETYRTFVTELKEAGLRYEEIEVEKLKDKVYVRTALDNEPDLRLIRILDSKRMDEREMNETYAPRILSSSLSSIDMA